MIYLFFTPVYSSCVFVWIVVVNLVLSCTSVYVAVVVTVRHALQLVIPSAKATLIITTNDKINFLIFRCVFR